MTTEISVLGIESSCDDSAAAVVRARLDRDRVRAPGVILSNVVVGQAESHAPFGGIVPEIAARAHAERLDGVIARALDEAGVSVRALDAIAVTAGPGLIGGVLAGVMTAKGLAAATGVPLIGVNHLEGHALTPRLTEGIDVPYLLLLASGGHCLFVAVEGLGAYRRLGGTIDDAPGEAFDKVAKLLGLGFPGGPEVERLAARGDPARFALPRPLIDRPGCDVSFSGLKTAVARVSNQLVEAQGGLYRRDVADLSAGFQAAVREMLSTKAARAMRLFRETHPNVASPVIAVAGGVAANRSLRAGLSEAADRESFQLVAPPLVLCTDNGAMIAWAGAEHFAAGHLNLRVMARPRWPLDQLSAPMLGSGKRGAKA